jgi:hypothetical protein
MQVKTILPVNPDLRPQASGRPVLGSTGMRQRKRTLSSSPTPMRAPLTMVSRFKG